jgi:hypothetical protein
VNGERTTKIVEKLGTYDELLKKLDGQNPIEWAKEYIAELNRKDRDEKQKKIKVQYSPTMLIPKDEQQSFNVGYLFLQKIYYQLKLDKICKNISDRHRFSFDLNAILSTLVYSRILYPASKMATHELSKRFLEQHSFQLQHIYRALGILAEEADYIQEEVYKNSRPLQRRNSAVIYYDCTNYMFEVEHEDGIKQYTNQREGTSAPMIHAGWFVDGNGAPLAFHFQNETVNNRATTTPLEQKILEDYSISRFIVCSDSGLDTSTDYRNSYKIGDPYIIVQPIELLSKQLKAWALNPSGWHLAGSDKIYDIRTIDDAVGNKNTYFKECWLNKDDKQKLIVTYSTTYKNHQKKIRNYPNQKKILMLEDTSITDKRSANDIAGLSLNKNYEIMKNVSSELLNITFDEQDETYDGFYAVCTNVQDETPEIISVNHQRWEIEECFFVMKNKFKSGSVYLRREDRIKAHFVTCFLAVVLYRSLVKKLGDEFTSNQIIHGLRDMNLYRIKGDGYIPTYTRNDFTDRLHDLFNFRTDYQILTLEQIKKIIKNTKKAMRTEL